MKRLHSGVILRATATVAMSAALAACSLWNLGPEPSNYVGPGSSVPQRLSDADLEAVTPVTQGDTGEGVAECRLFWLRAVIFVSSFEQQDDPPNEQD